MPTVSIVVEADSSEASAAIDQINQRVAALPPTFSSASASADSLQQRLIASGLSAKDAASAMENMGYKAQQTGAAAVQGADQMNAGFRETRVVTDVLTGNISRAEQALVRLGATSSALGPVIRAAFAPAAFVAFSEMIYEAVRGVEKLTGATREETEAAKEMNAAHEASRNSFQSEANEAAKFAEALALVGKKGADALQIEAAYAHLAYANEQARYETMLNTENLLKQRVAEARKNLADAQSTMNAPTLGEEASQGLFSQTLISGAQKQLDDAQAALDKFAGSKDFTKVEEAFQRADHEATLLDQRMKEMYGEEQQKNIAKQTKAVETETEAVERLLGANLKLDAETHKNAATDDVNNLLDANKRFEEQLKQNAKQYDENDKARQKAMQDLDMQMVNNMVADQKVAENAQKQAEEYARAWTRARDTMANQLNSFFDELTTGNIGKTFLRQFEKMVSEMVATWLMGIRGMQQGVTRSGGLFGTLFGFGDSGGGLFGGGASPAGGGALAGTVFGGSLGGGAYSLAGLGGSGGFTAADSATTAAGLTGPVADMTLPLSAGGGAALGAMLPAGAAHGLGGLFGDVFKSGNTGLGLMGIGMGAMGLKTLFSGGNGALGMLETIGGGALAGFEFGGPIGALIGAGAGLIGGLIGLFTGHGKRKKEQTAVLQQMERDLDNLQNAFDMHAVDYNSAISQAEQIRSSYTQQQEQIQQGGGPSRVDPWVNATETHINNLEAQRQNALAAAANFGPAQFESGGYVDASLARMAPAGFRAAMHFAMGGAVPAIVHAGEYVLSAAAVNRIGVGALENMNSGGSGNIHLHFHGAPIDGGSIQEFFSREETGRALRGSFRRMAFEGRI